MKYSIPTSAKIAIAMTIPKPAQVPAGVLDTASASTVTVAVCMTVTVLVVAVAVAEGEVLGLYPRDV